MNVQAVCPEQRDTSSWPTLLCPSASLIFPAVKQYCFDAYADEDFKEPVQACSVSCRCWACFAFAEREPCNHAAR